MFLQALVLSFVFLHLAMVASVNVERTGDLQFPFALKKVKCMRLSDSLSAFSVTYQTNKQHSSVWFMDSRPVFDNVPGQESFWASSRTQGDHYNSTLFLTMNEDELMFNSMSLHLFSDDISVVLDMNTMGIYDYEQNIYSMNYTPSVVEDIGKNISYSLPTLVVQTDKEDGGSFETSDVFTIDGFAKTIQMREIIDALWADPGSYRFSEEKSTEKLVTVTIRKSYGSSPLRSIRIEKEVGQPYIYPKETFSFNQYYTMAIHFPYGDKPYRVSRCSTIGSYKLKTNAEPEPGSYFRMISIFKGHRKDIYALERNFTRSINFSCIAYQEGTEKWPDMKIEATLDLMKAGGLHE